MKRPAFFSFHYANDVWRASQVRNIGVVDNDEPVSDNDWESIKRGGDRAIANWIENQLKYKQIVIVLIGAMTASRPWVLHEIKRAWELGKPMMGIRIHHLADSNGRTTSPGDNPFDNVTTENGQCLSQWVPVFEPYAYGSSSDTYNDIRRNLASWVEATIVRKRSQESSVCTERNL